MEKKNGLLLEYYFHKKQWKEDLTNEQMYYLSLLVPLRRGKNIARSRDGISLEQIGRTRYALIRPESRLQ